jgi:hypothetical protein
MSNQLERAEAYVVQNSASVAGIQSEHNYVPQWFRSGDQYDTESAAVLGGVKSGADVVIVYPNGDGFRFAFGWEDFDQPAADAWAGMTHEGSQQ